MLLQTFETLMNSYLALASVYLLVLFLISWHISVWAPIYRLFHFTFTVLALSFVMQQIIYLKPYEIDLKEVIGFSFESDYTNALLITTILHIIITNVFAVLRKRIYMSKLREGIRLGDPLTGFPLLRKKLKKIEELRMQEPKLNKSDIRKITNELNEYTIEGKFEFNRIIKLLGQGASVDLKTDGMTALFYVIGRKFSMKYQLILLFKALGANFDVKDTEGHTALSHFVYRIRQSQSDIRGFETLIAYSDINAKDKEGKTALMYDPEYFDNIKKKLIERGADLNVKDNRDKTVMHYALEAGNKKLVKALKKKGMKISTKEDEKKRKRDLSPKAKKQLKEDLLYIAQYGDSTSDDIQAVLNDGADINATDEVGATALMGAAEYGVYVVVEKLIDEGASLHNKNEEGQTALHLAVDRGNIESVKMLLEAGITVDEQDCEGTTPLMVAAHDYETEIIELLLEHKARKDIKDKEGNTAKDHAIGYGCKKGIKLLN
ncbi:MAG: hypothetical protein GQ564_19710 [Bacteroidales bacterium]|nr:hypothetical protein [Bacteroidales bacterium]